MSKASLTREYPASKEHNAILIMSTAALHNQGPVSISEKTSFRKIS